MISLIVAHGNNRVIGVNNQLPWHLPGELKYFKELTLLKPVIMGRKTFESIGKPLQNRWNIVVTRDEQYTADRIDVVNSLEAALNLTKGERETMIIGGAQIYERALEFVDRLYITKVDCDVEGDAYFPGYEHLFDEVSKSEVYEENGHRYQMFIYEKLK